jgi:hypothetical protein
VGAPGVVGQESQRQAECAFNIWTVRFDCWHFFPKTQLRKIGTPARKPTPSSLEEEENANCKSRDSN